LDRLDWHHIKVVRGRDLKAAVEAYRRDPDVLYAEPNYRLYANQRLIPNDPRFKELYGLDNTGQTGGTADADIDAPEAWASATNSSAVVAVIDTGIDYSHPDLAANI
jgi:subtilisin family serine protease